jgi:hypothetical protein
MAGYESDVSSSLKKQVTSVNVSTLYPGVCKTILGRRGQNLNMSKTSKLRKIFYLNKFGMKQILRLL